jgi:hypothetical protein
MSTKKEALKLAANLKLHLETWSPGDGVTRYRIFKKPTPYHGGGEKFTALGPKELLAWLTGYAEGSGRLWGGSYVD